MDGRPSGGGALREGAVALDRADWTAARAAYEAVLAEGDSVEARDGLAQALWFLGEVGEAVALRERVFDDQARAGRCDVAARTAVWVSHQHMIGGRASAARGWLARAERVLDGLPDCPAAGWVAVERARHAESVEEQVAHASRALDVARAHGDADLQVFAVSLLGSAHLSAGRQREGMRLLEEAMAGATSGRVRDVHTLAEAYCNLILACTSVGDWERATEWCELVDSFARSRAAPLVGSCRTVHADVLIAHGHWPDAERALEEALATHARWIPELGAATVASLAELRVQQGDLAAAERLLAGRAEHPAALRALALLRLAEGRAGVAVALLERGLRGAGGSAVAAAAVLAPLVEARLAVRDVPGAERAAAELAGLAASSGLRLLRARADLAAAQVALAVGDTEAAAESARCALAAATALLMPLDAGLARVALARALAVSAPEVARDEARTALAAFRSLGAGRAADAAAGVLHGLGSATGPRARVAGDLTAREREVLALLALGMSNAGIARTLVISQKTAGHHVSRILAKLGVRNRAEAAAYAVREGVASAASARTPAGRGAGA